MITKLVLREVALGELIKHHHTVRVVIELGLRRKLIAVAYISLRSAASAVSLRVKRVLVLDAQLIQADRSLCDRLWLHLLLQSVRAFAS